MREMQVDIFRDSFGIQEVCITYGGTIARIARNSGGIAFSTVQVLKELVRKSTPEETL